MLSGDGGVGEEGCGRGMSMAMMELFPTHNHLDFLLHSCLQLQRSVVASGEKQLPVEYRISKR